MKLLNKIFIMLSILFILSPIPSKALEDSPKKYVYLTFDDGPTKGNTPRLLDELERLNLPATFFVVGSLVKENPEAMKKMVDNNHSIGLHTMSHNRNKCYGSHESFIKENSELRDLLRERYNIECNIIRFPFGSQNSYLRMDKVFVDKLHNNNFKIFDWHIDTTDALNPNKGPQELLNICKRQYEKFYKDNSNIIILMHTNSNNDNTIKSLEGIKNYFLDLGYEFKSLDDNSKELYHIR